MPMYSIKARSNRVKEIPETKFVNNFSLCVSGSTENEFVVNFTICILPSDYTFSTSILFNTTILLGEL